MDNCPLPCRSLGNHLRSSILRSTVQSLHKKMKPVMMCVPCVLNPCHWRETAQAPLPLRGGHEEMAQVLQSLAAELEESTI